MKVTNSIKVTNSTILVSRHPPGALREDDTNPPGYRYRVSSVCLQYA